MIKSKVNAAWAATGLLFSLTAGAPAYADDVELLLTVPGVSAAARPNVLFILDSSGSMTTWEHTQEPFDGSNSYGGPCDTNYYYWTTGDTEPSCSSNNRRIRRDRFACAQGVIQSAASGKYTDTMAQYRKKSGKWKWRELKKNNDTRWVECSADSGLHGDGTAGQVFARRGSKNSNSAGNRFTNNPGDVVDWGASPTHQIVTVYDSNYLNWFHNPPTTSMRRTDIVKAVTQNVLGSMNNVNVGFMEFHWDQGGPVTHALKDLDTNRADAVATVQALPASGYTPLAETMYEAARYWRGMDRVYGQLGSTDPDALITGNNAQYKPAVQYACAKNFTVLLTDGAPTRDTGVFTSTGQLPGYASAMGTTACMGAGGADSNVNGACLDDVSEYMSKADMSPAVPGDQHVTTYTIGFTVDLPILKRTAENSGGKYYLADDVQSLTTALTDIVTNIFDRDISFTAPAVAVNTFNRTQHLNDLYVSVFRATDRQRWPGNLKKYTIYDAEIVGKGNVPAVDPSTGFFADSADNLWNQAVDADGANVYLGGAANILPNPGSRTIFTNNGVGDLTDPTNTVSVSNPIFVPADFGLTGDPGEPTMAEMIDWIHGADVKDEDNDPATTVRNSMGDTLHAQPASVVYSIDSSGNPDLVVFTATNDGYLHAVDGSTGIELWSFIPRELLTDFTDLYKNENINFKHYGIDGDIVPIVKDGNKDGKIDDPTQDFVYLVFGMRRGGDNYYALDVTNKTAPRLKWIQSYPEMGQSWSPPVAARVDVNTSAQTSPDEAVLIIGGGYDTAHDTAPHPSTDDLEGAGIVMLDLETGARVWHAGKNVGVTEGLIAPRMTRSIPTRIRVLDLTDDGYADRMYAADLGGQIWRFDIMNDNTPANLVAGGVIAQLGAEGQGATPSAAETRRFYNTPDIALFSDYGQDRRYLSVSIGSGYRAHPLDSSASDRFYSLRDPHIFKQLTQAEYNSYPIATDSDLLEVAGTFDNTVSATQRGWKLTLPPGEKVLADSTTFDNSIFFVTFEPTVASSDPCQAGLSVNRLYRVNIANGDPVTDLSAVDPNDPVAVDAERVTQLEQGGIAPKPTFIFPSPVDPTSCTGSACSPEPIGCIGVECFDPNFANNPRRTLWTKAGVE